MSGPNGKPPRVFWMDLRCGGDGCSRLLSHAYLPVGARVEIRCPKCGRPNAFKVLRSSSDRSSIALDTTVEVV